MYAGGMARHAIKREPPVVAREAAYSPAAGSERRPAPSVFQVTIADRGRLVLPAEIRERLHIRDGDRVAVSLEADGTVEIETRDVAIGKMRGMFSHLAPKDHLASDDLIAGRRRQAKREHRTGRAPATRA